MKYDVVINGQVLSLPMTGIPRYAWEMMKALDNMDELPFKAAVVVPHNSTVDYDFKHLDLIKIKSFEHDIFYTTKVLKRVASVVWTYITPEKFAKDNEALYVCFASKGPFYKKSLSTMHDIRPITYGEGKLTRQSLSFIAKFYATYKLALRNSKVLVTVSRFQKNEIKRYSNYDNVKVIGCGWEHMNETGTDETVFERYPQIKKGEYYFCVSSIAPHKNFEWIVKNAEKNHQNQYVIVGKTSPNMWGEDTSVFKDNIIWLGFQSDEVVKALLQSAKALVFPSKYEGFGIPPLEALALGTPAIVSDIPVMREIYGDSVSYIDPENPDMSLDIAQTEESIKARAEVLEKHSWKNSAMQWLELIKDNIQR